MSNRSDMLAVYHRNLDAFVASDEHVIRECMPWPWTSLGTLRAVSLDEFPRSIERLKSSRNWFTSLGLEFDVIAVTDLKAHVVLRNCERLQSDGTLIEEVSAFYASNGWRIFAVSSIEMPPACASGWLR